MLYRVVQVRQGGRRRRRTDVAADPGVVGELAIEFVAREPSERHLKQAVVYDPTWAQRPALLPPLRDPELVTINSRALLLRGIEFDPANGAEIVQEWWIRYLS